MKWIIYLLLLINIGFFAWHYQSTDVHQPREGVAEYGADEVITRLQLLSEVQSAPENEQKQWCYSAGPFLQKEAANQASSLLTSFGIESRQRRSNEAKQRGYWVLLPPAASRAAARKHVARLKELKIKDYFLVVSGEQTNGVSLGVFSKFESAHRRINEMTKLGFKPVLEKVKLPRKEFWLDWPREDDIKLSPQQLQQLTELEQGVTQIERTCQITAANPAAAKK